MPKESTEHPEQGAGAVDGVEAVDASARRRAAGPRRQRAMDRVGAFSGLAYVVLANLVGALVGEASSSAGSPGQRILDEQQRYAENPWMDVAFAVIVLAQLALIVFVGYLCSRVREAGWFATTALIGGATVLIANFCSVAIVVAIFVLRDVISPELALALQDVDGAGHLVQLLPFGVFVLFASAAALTTRTLGRVLSWCGIAVGATSIIGLAATGLPANDDFFLWPFLLVLVWIAAASLRLGLARNRTATPATGATVAG